MKIGFVWKRQLVYIITLVVVIAVGLGVGYLIHDVFERATVADDARGVDAGARWNVGGGNSNGAIAPVIPSLPFPTSPPSVSTPPGNPPSGGSTQR